MSSTKYPRLPRKNGIPYTTGDSQKWTYHYTWEDFEACCDTRENETEPVPTEKMVYTFGMLQYFSRYPADIRRYPADIRKSGILPDYTDEQIIGFINEMISQLEERIGCEHFDTARERWQEIINQTNS